MKGHAQVLRYLFLGIVGAGRPRAPRRAAFMQDGSRVVRACVRGTKFADACPQCSSQTTQPWTGRVGGAWSATTDLMSDEESCSVGVSPEVTESLRAMLGGKD